MSIGSTFRDLAGMKGSVMEARATRIERVRGSSVSQLHFWYTLPLEYAFHLLGNVKGKPYSIWDANAVIAFPH